MATGTTTLEQLWEAAGGNPGKAQLAAAVALAESGGRPDASNTNTNGTIDRGLWQINSIHGPLSTFDPTANARAAVQISANGTNWGPWCTAWSDGACGTKGGSPPPAGGLAPGSPAARMLGNAAGATVGAGSATTGGTQGASSVGPQGWGGLVIGVVELLAGGALLLVGVLLAARMAADTAGLSPNIAQVPIVGTKARSTRRAATTAAIETDSRRRVADARATAAESRAAAASSRAAGAARPAPTSVPGPRSRPYRPRVGTPTAEVNAERRRRGLVVIEGERAPFDV